MPDVGGMDGDVLDAITVQFGELLVRLAGRRPELLVVTGDDPGPMAWFGQIWPERIIPVNGGATRLSVARGISAGGGTAVVALDDMVADLSGGVDAPVLLISSDPAHLGAAYRAGLAVCQAGWAADLDPLLTAALDADESVLVFLAPLPALAQSLPAPRTPAQFGTPRVLHQGGAGLVVGAGPTATVAAAVAQQLAVRGTAVTALDNHTLPADSGVDPMLLQQNLLVGPLTAARAGALQAVTADPADIVWTASAVRRALGG